MHIITLSRSNETVFYDHIKGNFAQYFFFHVDYAQYPESTKIFMAYHEDTIQAMLLIWSDKRIQVRGNLSGIDFLLRNARALDTIEPISITGFEEHQKLITERYPHYKHVTLLYRMGLKVGNQNDFEEFSSVQLTENQRTDMVSLMRIADPEYWGTREPEDLLIDENNLWYGIKKQDRLVSITGVWLYDKVGYITVVGTHPDYWNKGLASSLISSVLKGISEEQEHCFIMVRAENHPAIHTYEKLGFKICNTHYNFEKKD